MVDESKNSDQQETAKFPDPIKFFKASLNAQPLTLFILGNYNQVPEDVKKKITVDEHGRVQIPSLENGNPFDEIMTSTAYLGEEWGKWFRAQNNEQGGWFINDKYNGRSFSLSKIDGRLAAAATLNLPFGVIIELLTNPLFSSTYLKEGEGGWKATVVTFFKGQKMQYNSQNAESNFVSLLWEMENCYTYFDIEKMAKQTNVLKHIVALLDLELLVLEKYLQIPYMSFVVGMIARSSDFNMHGMKQYLGEIKAEVSGVLRYEFHQRLSMLFRYMEFLQKSRKAMITRGKFEEPEVNYSRLLELEDEDSPLPLKKNGEKTSPHLFLAEMWFQVQEGKNLETETLERWKEIQKYCFRGSKHPFQLPEVSEVAKNFADSWKTDRKQNTLKKENWGVGVFSSVQFNVEGRMELELTQNTKVARITNAKVEEIKYFAYNNETKTWVIKRYRYEEGDPKVSAKPKDSYDIVVGIEPQFFPHPGDRFLYYSLDSIKVKINYKSQGSKNKKTESFWKKIDVKLKREIRQPVFKTLVAPEAPKRVKKREKAALKQMASTRTTREEPRQQQMEPTRTTRAAAALRLQEQPSNNNRQNASIPLSLNPNAVSFQPTPSALRLRPLNVLSSQPTDSVRQQTNDKVWPGLGTLRPIGNSGRASPSLNSVIIPKPVPRSNIPTTQFPSAINPPLGQPTQTFSSIQPFTVQSTVETIAQRQQPAAEFKVMWTKNTPEKIQEVEFKENLIYEITKETKTGGRQTGRFKLQSKNGQWTYLQPQDENAKSFLGPGKSNYAIGTGKSRQNIKKIRWMLRSDPRLR